MLTLKREGRDKDSLLVSDLLDFNVICAALSRPKVRLKLRGEGVSQMKDESDFFVGREGV